jgi:hypothetical protein
MKTGTRGALPKSALAALVTVAIGCAAGPAAALTWNTCDDGSDSGSLCDYSHTESARTSTGTGSDQQYTFDALTDATADLLVRAYRTSDSLGTGPLTRTVISLWEGGLGAGGESTSPEHAVDNIGRDEYLIFYSATAIVWDSFKIGYKGADADISAWVGTSPDLLLSLTSIPWSGGPTTGSWTPYSFSNVAVNTLQALGATGNYLIIGATSETAIEQQCSGKTKSKSCKDVTVDDGEDAFKLLQINGSIPTTSGQTTSGQTTSGQTTSGQELAAPGSPLALLALGLGLWFLVPRRRTHAR